MFNGNNNKSDLLHAECGCESMPSSVYTDVV